MDGYDDVGLSPRWSRLDEHDLDRLARRSLDLARACHSAEPALDESALFYLALVKSIQARTTARGNGDGEEEEAQHPARLARDLLDGEIRLGKGRYLEAMSVLEEHQRRGHRRALVLWSHAAMKLGRSGEAAEAMARHHAQGPVATSSAVKLGPELDLASAATATVLGALYAKSNATHLHAKQAFFEALACNRLVWEAVEGAARFAKDQRDLDRLLGLLATSSDGEDDMEVLQRQVSTLSSDNERTGDPDKSLAQTPVLEASEGGSSGSSQYRPPPKRSRVATNLSMAEAQPPPPSALPSSSSSRLPWAETAASRARAAANALSRGVPNGTGIGLGIGGVAGAAALPKGPPPVSRNFTNKATTGRSSSVGGPTAHLTPNPNLQDAPPRRSHRLGVPEPSKKSRDVHFASRAALGRRERDVKRSKMLATLGLVSTPTARVNGQDRIRPESSVSMLDVKSGSETGEVGGDTIDALLVDLFHALARVLAGLYSFKCREALDLLNRFPGWLLHANPYLLCWHARLRYEISDYSGAQTLFEKYRQLEPHSMMGMDIYSTVLWQLNRPVDLAYLAHDLSATDRETPETWIAVGNTFSLQNERLSALACFAKATQLAPTHAYAYILSGHESVANEQLDNGIAFYRSALRCDASHYNAWYGLGRIYTLRGDLDTAGYYINRACEINSSHASLMCSQAIIYERKGQNDVAMRIYDRGSELAPRSPFLLFRKARLLVVTGQVQAALRILVHLAKLVPDESNVHLLLGRIYIHLGHRKEASEHLTIAQNCDPRLASQVREILQATGPTGAPTAGLGGLFAPDNEGQTVDKSQGLTLVPDAMGTPSSGAMEM